MTIIYSLSARNDLDMIADWNEQNYGREHAKKYISFLTQRISALATTFESGRRLASRPSLQYIVIQRRPNSYGHIVVYSVADKTVVVTNIFHTSQNWQTQLTDDA